MLPHSILPIRLPGRALLVAAVLALAAISAVLMTASPASACPIQGCGHEPDDPVPHPPPGPPPPKYRITIDTLRAYETEDSFEDQAYIQIKGSHVWGPHGVNPLQMAYPNVSRDVTGPIWVSLYDDDDFWWDGDDWLGDAYAPLPASVGSTSWGVLRFTQDDADYTMTVHVLRLS
jgi:hypothetical protein